MYITEIRYQEITGSSVSPVPFELIQDYAVELFKGYYTDFPSEEEFLTWETEFPECYKNIENGIALQMQFIEKTGGLNSTKNEGVASVSLGRFSKRIELNDDGSSEMFSDSALVFTDRCCSFEIQLVDEGGSYLC